MEERCATQGEASRKSERVDEHEDPRVAKTRTHLRQAFIALLSEVSFDDMTVTEICNRAHTTRITFYAHYSDKYDLAEEVFVELIAQARAEFYDKEGGNADKNAVQGYRNLLDAILDLYYDNSEFFYHTSQSENPYLYSSLYRHLVDRVAHYIQHHAYMRSPRYSPAQLSSFICGGIWSFVDESQTEDRPPEQIRAQAHDLLKGVLQSDVLELA